MNVASGQRRSLRRFLSLFALANAGGVLAYTPLLGLLLPLEAAAIDAERQVWILSIANLAGAIAASGSNIVWGAASDRSFRIRGTRRGWIAAGLPFTFAGYAWIALAHSVAQLVLGVIFFQIAVNLLLAPLLALAADRVPDGQKGLIGGLLVVAAPATYLLGGLIIAAGPHREWMRFVLIGAGVTILVAPLLLLSALDKAPAAIRSPAPKLTVRSVLRGFGLIWVSRSLVQTASVLLTTIAIFYFAAIFGLSNELTAARLGELNAVALGFGAVLALVFGRWSDRIGTRRPFLLASAMLCAGGAIVMAIAANGATAIAGFLLFFAGSEAFIGVNSALGLQLLPSPDHRGRDLGLLNLSNTLPLLLAPLLLLILVPRSGNGFAIVLVIVAALALAGAAVTLMVERSADRLRDDQPPGRSR